MRKKCASIVTGNDKGPTYRSLSRLGDRTSLTLGVTGAQSKKRKQTEHSSRVQPVDGPKKSRYEAMDLDTPNTTETAATGSQSRRAP